MKQKYTKALGISITSVFLFMVAFFGIANTSEKIVFSDSDQDGLSDEEELQYGTDPNNKDTDGDGYSDGTEVKSGYDPLKPAPGDKIIATESSSSEIDQSGNGMQGELTKEILFKTTEFINANDQKVVTTEDVDDFVQENFKEVFGNTAEILPEVDMSKIKIKKQKYSDLSDEERIEKMREDKELYLNSMMYAYFSYTVREIKTSESGDQIFRDIESSTENFKNKATRVFSESPDYEYFRELAPKIEGFIAYAQEMEIPEDAFELHKKTLSILQAYIDLRDPSMPIIENDSFVKMLTFAKVSKLGDLAQEYISIDLNNFIAN